MKNKTFIAFAVTTLSLIIVGCKSEPSSLLSIDSSSEISQGENMEINRSRTEFEGYVNNLSTFPTSFIYGDVGYQGFREDKFTIISHSKEITGPREHYVFVMRMSDGLIVTLDTSYYDGYDAFDWTVYFENKGVANSKILRVVNAADYFIPGDNALIRGIMGDHQHQYRAYVHNLKENDFLMENVIGRSTHRTFPYYNIETDEGGANVAIGWPGTFRAKMQFNQNKKVTNFIGQGCIDFAAYLKPGEKVQTPLIGVVRYYERNEYTAINAWRRWYVDCNAPAMDADGKKFTSVNGVFFKRDINNGFTNDASSETYKTWRRSFEKVIAENIEFDLRLIDAAWYATPNRGSTTDDWWAFVGTWDVDKNKWPGDSFKETIDFGHEHGAFTQLWFESERVTHMLDLEANYGFDRRWAIADHGDNELNFVNLGMPEALEWIKGRVLPTIRDYKIGLYREDFNAEPHPAWETNDNFNGPNRKGMTENLYIQGHFDLWEAVIETQLSVGGCNYIDNCASGGGRNDLLSLRYSFPFNRSDADWAMVQPHSIPLRLSFSHSTFKWLPIAGVYVNEMADGKLGMYNLRASYTPIVTYACKFYHNANLDWDNLRKAQQEWNQINHFLTKDYYPLTPYHKVSDEKSIDVFQFMDRETGEGIIQAFRRERCPERVVEVKVQALDPNAYYKITDFDGNNTLEQVKGSALMKGFPIVLEQKGSACVLLINKI